MGLQLANQGICRIKFIIARLHLLHRLFMNSLQLLVSTLSGVQVTILGCKLVRSSLF